MILMGIRDEIQRYKERRECKGTLSPHKIKFTQRGNFVVAVITQQPISVGVAKCNPNCDKFNLETGMKIALWRALDGFAWEEANGGI